MKRSELEKKQRMLDECIRHNRCDDFVRHYWNLVYAAVRRIFQMKKINPASPDIEDVRQEVFVRLLENGRKRLASFDPAKGTSPEGWLILLSTRIALSHMRKKNMHSPENCSSLIPLENLLHELCTSEAMKQTEDRLALSRICELLPGLPPVERLVVKMYYFDGISFQEIADTLHKSLDNIYVIRSRAIKNLKKQIDKIE